MAGPPARDSTARWPDHQREIQLQDGWTTSDKFNCEMAGPPARNSTARWPDHQREIQLRRSECLVLWQGVSCVRCCLRIHTVRVKKKVTIPLKLIAVYTVLPFPNKQSSDGATRLECARFRRPFKRTRKRTCTYTQAFRRTRARPVSAQ